MKRCTRSNIAIPKKNRHPLILDPVLLTAYVCMWLWVAVFAHTWQGDEDGHLYAASGFKRPCSKP